MRRQNATRKPRMDVGKNCSWPKATFGAALDGMGWRHVCLLFALVLTAAPRWSRAADISGTPEPPWFRAAVAQIAFRGVNRNDAKAAFRIFLENHSRRAGLVYKIDTQVYDNSEAFEAALLQTPIELAVIEGWQYLAMNLQGLMKPCFTVMESERVGRRYLVLTRRDSGLNTLDSLRGKSLLQSEVAAGNVGRVWLSTLLLARKLGTREDFFGSVKIEEKPSAAVLPVFFGRHAACLVDEPVFEVMKELNPQVGQQLQVIEQSAPYGDVLLCMKEQGWNPPETKQSTITALRDLHLDPVGQQICTLFKIDRAVPFEDSQLETLRQLRATYSALLKGAGKALANSADENVPDPSQAAGSPRMTDP